MNPLYKANVSAIYPLTMLQLAEERGLAVAALLAGTGLNAEALRQPAARVTAEQLIALSEHLLALGGDPGVGIELGLRAKVTKMGLVGLALMSCATFREVIELGIRYLPTKVPFFRLTLGVEGSTAVVTVTELLSLGLARQLIVDHFMTEAFGVIGSLGERERFVAARDSAEIWFDSPAQPYYAAYAGRLPRLRFDMPGNQFRFSAALLDTPIRTANPVTARMVIEQCDQEMARLGLTESLANRVRALLDGRDGLYPTLGELAAELHVSTRTLKRRLATERSSFRDLLDEVRQRDSQRLLLDPGRSIEEVALRVGYPDPSNFRRAFRRWTGLSPSAYRERQKL